MDRTPNVVVEYVDATTKQVLCAEEHHDPFLGWVIDDRTGRVYLHVSYCGRPTDAWFAAHARPFDRSV